MAFYKDDKIMPPIKQMAKVSENKYEINGIDLTKAVFFYRDPQGTFVDMSTADYRIDQEAGNTYFVVTNSNITSSAESFQICYEISITSSRYDPIFNPDINTLKDKYNQLFEDFQVIFDHVRKNLIVSDDQTMITVMPQLDKDEVWVKTADGGWRGWNIGDLEGNLADFWVKFIADTEKLFADLEAAKDEQIVAIDTRGNFQVTRIENQAALHEALMIQMERLSALALGSKTYLNGGNLPTRDSVDGLVVDADGGVLATRDTLRRTYDGGDLGDRLITIDNILNLAEGA